MYEGSELFFGKPSPVHDIYEQECIEVARSMSWFRACVLAYVILEFSRIMVQGVRSLGGLAV